MKRTNIWALLLAAMCGVGVVGVVPEAAAQSRSGSASKATKAQAQSLFDEGKRLYDGKDYAGALGKFRQGAALEPDKGRWPYNQALALRKLKRKSEAIDAFLEARRVEPGYKSADVTQKLSELGYSPSSETPRPSDTGTQPVPSPSTVTPEPQPGGTGTSSGSLPTSPRTESGSDTRSRTDNEASPSVPRTHVSDTAGSIMGSLMCCVCPVLGLGGLGYLIYRLIQKKKGGGGGGPGTGWPQPTGPGGGGPVALEDLEARGARLSQVSETLIRVEHGLRLGEDDDARALLNRATSAEYRAQEALNRARDGKGPLSAVDSALAEAESASREAEARVQSVFGPLAFSGQGERVGCYFCARPLANSDYRVQVPLKRGGGTDSVLACRACANLVEAGQTPQVKVRQEGGRMLHWSELPDYDPYIHRHRPYLGSRSVPVYDFAPQRSVAELAAMAAGGAVVGGLAMYGVSKLLDLDGARESAMARAAAEEMARRSHRHHDTFGSSSSSIFDSTPSSSSSEWRDRS